MVKWDTYLENTMWKNKRGVNKGQELFYVINYSSEDKALKFLIVHFNQASPVFFIHTLNQRTVNENEKFSDPNHKLFSW